MTSQVPEISLAARPPEALPAVIVDVREPGSLAAAVSGALQAADLQQGMVAIVLVPLGATSAPWSGLSFDRRLSEPDDGLLVDALVHEVRLHDRVVPVTFREFAVLSYLYQRRGAVVTREQLLRDVWGESYRGGARTVDIHIRRLRAKLGADWFETFRGVGYKLRRRR